MKQSFKIILPLLAAGFVTVSVGHAQQSSESTASPLWKTVGDWDVRVDTTLNYGCFIAAAYETGTVVRVGFDETHSGGYILIGSPEWTSLEIGKDYDLEFQFDNEPPWEGTATAIPMGEVVLLFLPFHEPSFMSEMQRKHALMITYRGRVVANLTLRGSYAAIQELVNCQLAVEEARAGSPTPGDPFATSPRPTRNDPFE